MSLDARAPVFTWIDSALSHAEAGTLPNFIEEFRLVAALSIGYPGTPNAAVIPSLREAETLEPWYDFLVDLAQASEEIPQRGCVALSVESLVAHRHPIPEESTWHVTRSSSTPVLA